MFDVTVYSWLHNKPPHTPPTGPTARNAGRVRLLEWAEPPRALVARIVFLRNDAFRDRRDMSSQYVVFRRRNALVRRLCEAVFGVQKKAHAL